EAPHPTLGGGRHRAAGRTVIAPVGRENGRRAGVPACRLDRELDRVCAGDTEQDTLGVVARSELNKPLCQSLAWLVRKVEVMDQPLALPADRLEHGLMAVAEVVDREAGEHVDVVLAVGVVDERSFAADDRRRALEQAETDLPGRLVCDLAAQDLLRLRPEW